MRAGCEARVEQDVLLKLWQTCGASFSSDRSIQRVTPSAIWKVFQCPSQLRPDPLGQADQLRCLITANWGGVMAKTGDWMEATGLLPPEVGLQAAGIAYLGVSHLWALCEPTGPNGRWRRWGERQITYAAPGPGAASQGLAWQHLMYCPGSVTTASQSVAGRCG